MLVEWPSTDHTIVEVGRDLLRSPRNTSSSKCIRLSSAVRFADSMPLPSCASVLAVTEFRKQHLAQFTQVSNLGYLSAKTNVSAKCL